MAARASSAATWCAPSPRPGRACGSRSGGPSSPATSSRSAASARSMPCRPMCAFPIRCSPPPTAPMPSSISSASLFPSGKQTFKSVQDEGARHVAEAARAAGARALVHVSAIGASRRRAVGLCAQQGRRRGTRSNRSIADAVILRPSIVFGPEDDFFNRFAALARIAPALPLIGGGKTKLEPVFAGDVAKAVIAGLTGKADARRALRARRARGADPETGDAARARLHDAQAPARAGAVLARQAARLLLADCCRSRRSPSTRCGCSRPTMW